MDSITQIVLGAAVGEAVLGKKIGNRAMFWGGVGGTIPDLDIVMNYILPKVDALAAHRGFSHSIVFACLGALVFGWLIYQLYKSPYYKWIALISRIIFSSAVILLLFYSGLKDGKYLVLILSLLIAYFAYVWHHKRYFRGDSFKSDVHYKEWVFFFFMALFTHPLLDCFTMYGTQLFAPFSDYRVAFSTVSVADPLYTVPFIICLLTASFYNRKAKNRRRWNYAGIIISCTYLLFTVWNKNRVNTIFEQQLAHQNIEYNRCITGPTILNNVLWNATIETDTEYLHGQYSFFDTSAVQFKSIPKNHNLIEGSETDRTISILKWFTNGFYNIIIRKDGQMQLNDLRFGTFEGEGNGENDFIFRFLIKKEEDGHYKMLDSEGGPPDGDRRDMIKILWKRMKGI